MNTRFLSQFTDFIFIETPVEPSDIIFLPGNSFPQMAEESARLYRDGCAPLILPSGAHALLAQDFRGVTDRTGKYPGCFPTEWEFLHHILVQNGVPSEAVLREDRASFTYENAVFSRQVTDALSLSVRRAIICCNAYHARRCFLYYQLLFPDTHFFIRPVNTGINRDNWYRTEKGIDTVLGELERCGSQFHQILRGL